MKIKHLTIDCANLDELKYFYTRKFKFKILEETDELFTIKLGDSLLTFKENRLKKAYYHFAVNISYNAIEQALDWLNKRVDVLTTDDGKIKNFESWDAKALYFIDPAGNVVEFIGRSNFNKKRVKSFSESSVLNISEVGLPVFQVSTAYNYIAKATGLEKFRKSNNTFCAVGDDEGLLILVDSAENVWYPTEERTREYRLEVIFSIGRSKHFKLTLADENLEINAYKK